MARGVSGAYTPWARQWSWSHGALRFPAAKPTNWVEGTQAVLRAKKGQDDKVLVATCTSANGKPPSVVSWETRLKGEAEYQEIRNPNGTVTVISRYRLVPSREAHQQSLACIVNYHMDRFRESLTLNVQCEQGAGRAGSPGWAPPSPAHPPPPVPALPPPLLLSPTALPSPPLLSLASQAFPSLSLPGGALASLLSSPISSLGSSVLILSSVPLLLLL